MENKLEMLIKYTYGKKEYYIVLKDNKIYFACNENSKIEFKLNDEEVYIALKVYTAFLAKKKNAIKVDRIHIEDRKYEIFYDKESRNFFWNALNYNSDENKEDNILLNIMYNHQNPIIFAAKHIMTSFKQKFYTKLILIRTITIVAFCSAIINPITFAQNYEVSSEYSSEVVDGMQSSINKVLNETQRTVKIIVDKVDEKIYNWNKLKQAIEQNNNLGNDEKEFLYNLKFIFDAHHDNMDLKLIEQRLRRLKINYKDEMYITKSGNFITAGWSSSDCSITVWPTPELYDSGEKNNFKTTDKENLIHDMLHLLQGEDKNFPKLYEASTEFEARNIYEILKNKGIIAQNKDDKRIRYGKGYDSLLPVYYILSKFMTNEEILNFQYTGNMEHIAQALTRFGTEEEAYELLTKIKTTDFDDCFDEDNGEKIRAIYKKLNDYYKKANGKNIYDDLEFIAIIASAKLEWEFCNDETMTKNIELFKEIIKNELIKNGIINSEDNAIVVFNLYDFNYSNNLFFGEYRKYITFYPEVIVYEGENREYRFLAIQITEEMQQEFDKARQRITEGNGIDR